MICKLSLVVNSCDRENGREEAAELILIKLPLLLMSFPTIPGIVLFPLRNSHVY